MKNILGESPIGSFTAPIYWDGSSFKEAIIPGAIALENTSWELIKQLADAGTIQNYFKVGDKKSFNLTDGSQHDAVILGFNQDSAYDSSTKTGTVVTFAISGSFGTSPMLDEAPDTTFGTSFVAGIIYDLCKSDYLALIPNDLSEILLEVRKECEYYKGTFRFWDEDYAVLKLFPLDSWEICGYGNSSTGFDDSKIYSLFKDKKFISGWSSQWCRNGASTNMSYFAYNITPSSSYPVNSEIYTHKENVCLAFCI